MGMGLVGEGGGKPKSLKETHSDRNDLMAGC